MHARGSFRLIAIVALATGFLAASAGAGTKPNDELTAGTPIKINPTPTTSPGTASFRFAGGIVELTKGKPFQTFTVKYNDTTGLKIVSTALQCSGTVKLSNNPTLQCASGWSVKFTGYSPTDVTLTLIQPTN